MTLLRNFLLLTLLLSTATTSFACSRRPGEPEPTNAELFGKAKAVFVAHVYRTEETTQSISGIPIVVGHFKIIEVLKGSPPIDGKVKDFVFGYGNCSLGLMSGLDYIFFVPDGAELVLWPEGSRPILNLEGKETKMFLEILRQLATEKGQQ